MPTNLQYTTATTNNLTAAWNTSAPPGDSYTLQLSSANDFSILILSSNTVLTGAVIGSLSVNTTYYGRVNSIISGSSSAWSPSVSTATLANIPATAVSTWTSVQFTSVTVNWLTGGNPSNVTKYIVELST